MTERAAGQRGLRNPHVAVVKAEPISSLQRPEPGRLGGGSSLKAFGLASNPFSKGPVSGYLPLLSCTRQAIAQLTQAIEGRNGLLVLTGDVGTGKTTVLNQLRAWLAKRAMPTAYLFNPLMDARNFIDFVLAEFGIQAERGSAGSAFTQLSNWLFAGYRDGATPVLIIDEAQTLAPSVLQALGPLLNLESSSEKLLQVVLAGQPGLNDVLREPEFRPLRQRIALRCRTAPLSFDETQAYVEARLRAAGSGGNAIFSADALHAVYLYSRGIPRLINLLCEYALSNACAEQVQAVPAEIVDRVARELQFEYARPLAVPLNTESVDATLRAMRGRSHGHESTPEISASTAPVKEFAAPKGSEGDTPHTITIKPEAPALITPPEGYRPVLLQVVPGATAPSTSSRHSQVVAASQRISASIARLFRSAQASARVKRRVPGLRLSRSSRDWRQTWASLAHWLKQPIQFRPRS
jgi:general secretion pathway protein A